MLLQLTKFSPFALLHLVPLPSSNPPPLGSCPWVMHRSSLASPLSILILTSACLFCTYELCFLFSIHFSLSSPSTLSTNPPKDLHIYDSVPVLVVCLVCFHLLKSAVDSCELIVILLIIVFIFSFFLNKSL